MKLLLDENLSPALANLLADIFPQCTHVRDLGLEAATDSAIWDLALREGFAIVSKDGDFRQRSFVYGHPPKAVWIRLGNCSTQQIALLMRRKAHEIQRFLEAEDESFLALG